MVCHAAWHHVARKHFPAGPLSADAMFLGEAVASAFDLYLVGRLLRHVPDAEFLETQVPAMTDVARVLREKLSGWGLEMPARIERCHRAGDDTRKALVGKIGENMSIRRFKRVAAEGALNQYIHGGAKVGVLVDIAGGDVVLAKDVAMHIAASKPKSLDPSGVPAEDIAKERAVAEGKAAESGKPAEIVAKMVEGSVAKYLKEVSLLSQPFVKDDKLTIEALMKSKGAAVKGFTLYVVGEGIEKKVTDFAAEVAEAAAAAKPKDNDPKQPA